MSTQTAPDPTWQDEIEVILGYRFSDPSLLERAMTHSSIAPTRLESNERLEFLGDAVLGMIVCDHIYRAFPEFLEGDMTKIKSDTVSRRKCAQIAEELGFEQFLNIGKGMQGRASLPTSLLAAALESIIGAMYIDGGFEPVRAFLEPHIEEIVDRAARSGHQQNFKSALQQHAQQILGASPVYELMDEQGPDHDKAFLVGVTIDGVQHGPCWAGSKKQAEQLAAKTALESMGLLVENESGELIVEVTDEGELLDEEPEFDEDSDDVIEVTEGIYDPDLY